MMTEEARAARVPLHIRMVTILFFLGATIWLFSNTWLAMQLLLYGETVSGQVIAISSSRFPSYHVEITTEDFHSYTAWASTFFGSYQTGESVELQWLSNQAESIRFPGFSIRMFISVIMYTLCLYIWWTEFIAVVCNRYSENLPESTKKLFR